MHLIHLALIASGIVALIFVCLALAKYYSKKNREPVRQYNCLTIRLNSFREERIKNRLIDGQCLTKPRSESIENHTEFYCPKSSPDK